MTNYKLPLWREDRLLFIVLLSTAALSAWLWWVPIRCVMDGPGFEWANEFGDGRIGGAGMQGDFLVLVLLSAFLTSILYMGWRGAHTPFKPLLLLWTSTNLISSIAAALASPDGVRFRGDTMGIDIDITWWFPAIKGALVALILFWLYRDATRPRSRTVAAWTRLNTGLLIPIVVLLPLQFAMLRFGPMHGIADKIGWLITFGGWVLLNLSFMPWAVKDSTRAAANEGTLHHTVRI